ncbi:hypothetical protein DV515_00016879 [Chloebia gouldiae]|uniref:CCHC-type domain-containing protein n=1 Tax=Chloebia gouldiae TaxID=44316 RepID=A0A3L8RA22_CHLGU|nr:hypothetical protein DV515_00016879 [Chloebia gouldiae]
MFTCLIGIPSKGQEFPNSLVQLQKELNENNSPNVWAVFYKHQENIERVKIPVVNPLLLWQKWVLDLPAANGVPQELELFGSAKAEYCIQFDLSPVKEVKLYEQISQNGRLNVTSTSDKCGVCVKEKGCLECLALKESLSQRNDTDADLQVAPARPREPNPIPAPTPTSSPASLNPTLSSPISPTQPFSPYPPLPPSPDPSSPGDDLNLAVIHKMGEDESEGDSDSGDESESAILVSHRTQSRSKPARVLARKALDRQKRTVIAPLQQGIRVEGPVLVKVSFSPADLVIWKQSAGTYRENPDKIARAVEIIMKTQNPDWDDIQVILDTLMDSTVKEMVLKAAKERAREDIRNRIVMGILDDNFPTGDPRWDPNAPEHMQRLKKYQEWVQIGVQNAVPKTINWSKLCEIRQEKKESPTAFLERLKEAARKYTDHQIDTPQAKVHLALIFLGQSQDDIRRKLQKLEGEELRNLDKLLEVSWKVYNNRKKEISKRQQQNILALIQGKGNQGMRGRGRGGHGLGRGGGLGRGHGRTAVPKFRFNQCAFCKQEGHWKNECPNQFYQGNQPRQDQDIAKLMVLGQFSD